MSVPIARELGNSFTLEWEDEKIVARVERVYQHTRGDVSAEITFRTTTVDPAGLIHHSMCSNLLGPRSRSTIAKDCYSKWNLIDEKQWLSIVETCFEHVVTRVREGEPPELLIDVPMDTEVDDFLLHPILHRGHATVLFGLGGSLKSTLTAWMAHRVANAIDGEGANVAILDWESTSKDWARKMREIAVGLGEEEPAVNVTYRRMSSPLADDIEAVYNLGTKYQIGFWVLDSAMWACGGRPEEAEHAMAMFRALRSLGGTSLIIAHQNNDENTKRPYGNVMWVNAPRSVIQVQRSQLTIAENEVVIGLTQRKVNYGRPFAPLGFTATFHQQSEHGFTVGDYVTLRSSNPLEEEDLAQNVAMPQRVKFVLRAGRMTKEELIAKMDVPFGREKSLASTIDRLIRDRKIQRLPDGKLGLTDHEFANGREGNVATQISEDVA